MEVVFESAIYTTSYTFLTIKGKIWTSHTTGVISMCKNYELFCTYVIICTSYSSIFNMPCMTGFISPLLIAFLDQIFSGGLFCTIKSQIDTHKRTVNLKTKNGSLNH